MKRTQRTIKSPVEINGIGLHTGEEVTVRFKPADPDTGVTFIRLDLEDQPRIPAHIDNVSRRLRRTSLRKEGAEIQTVEHLLAALAGLRIDNLEVELTGKEIPGVDGSALPFIEKLSQAGIMDQRVPKKCFTLESPVSVKNGESSLVALPSPEGLSISYTLDYRNAPFLRPQYLDVEITPEFFEEGLAPARTFCLESEVEDLKREGLGKGATPQNTLVVGESGVKENELRFSDEFVRHKVLDLLGDLFLLNMDLQAHILATKSGHSDNLELVKKILNVIQDMETQGLIHRDTGLDIREIQRILPHRFPFLLIDRVISLEGFKRAVGIKNVTINEQFFQGHWPGQPIMPGVLHLEAMAQLAGVLLLRKLENTGKLAVLTSIDKVRLRRAVVPGDQLRLEAEAIKVKTRSGYVYTRATVNGELVAEAWMKFMMVDS